MLLSSNVRGGPPSQALFSPENFIRRGKGLTAADPALYEKDRGNGMRLLRVPIKARSKMRARGVLPRTKPEGAACLTEGPRTPDNELTGIGACAPCRRRRTGAYGTERKSHSGNQGAPESGGHCPTVRRPETQWASLGSALPFPSGDQASFSINEEEGFFYCFGCQASGDLFDFYGQINGLDFKETLEQLAEEAGVTLERGPAKIRRPTRRAVHVQTAAVAENP